MSTHRPAHLIALALACAAIAASLALVACGPAVPPVPEDAIQPDFEREPLEKRMMPFEKRQATMPEKLPVEIPVIDGSVLSTSTEVGNRSWMYSIDTTGPMIVVADWYSRAYSQAQWQTEFTTETPKGTAMQFKKHGARTTIGIKPAKAGRVRVDASVGLGMIPPVAY